MYTRFQLSDNITWVMLHLQKNYPEVCDDCTKKIAKFIDDIRVEN